MQCADLKIFGAIPNAVTFSGDYNLPAGDTIDEDVTVTGGNAVIDGVISGDLAVMGGAVDVNGTITGDVAVFGGNLEMNGYIDGDAAVLGGNIRNKGTIDGDLHVIGGTVYLDSASAVNGDVSMVGGTVERDENAVVLGKIESVEIKVLEKVLPRISKAFRLPRMVPGAEAFPRIVFIGMLVVMFVLNIFVVLLFPRATGNIAEKIQQSVWACVGLGIAFEILFVPIIVLLAVSIVGIPLIILLPLAVLLATLFGMTALSLIVGERVVAGFKWNVESDIGKFCLGWLAIMLIPIVVILIGPPVFVIGAVIFYIATTISLGSVIYTLMRRKKVAEAKK
jgi:cytoskeletal protein CcmA (bactofilin family)